MAEGEKQAVGLSIPWVGVLIGVPYLVGYLTVAVYLARFSVVPLDLIRVQYIAAGAWSMLPLLLFFLPLSYLGGYLHDAFVEKDGREVASRWRYACYVAVQVVTSLVGAVGICGVLISLLKFSIGDTIDAFTPAITTYEIFEFLAIAFAFACGIVLTASVTWTLLRNVKPHEFWQSFNNLAWGCCFFFLMAGAVVGYVLFFATNMYGKIPSYLGGGAPVPVEIALKEKDGLENTAKQFSGSYYLLTSTEHNLYLFRQADRQAIEMSREIVAIIKYATPARAASSSPQKPN